MKCCCSSGLSHWMSWLPRQSPSQRWDGDKQPNPEPPFSDFHNSWALRAPAGIHRCWTAWKSAPMEVWSAQIGILWLARFLLPLWLCLCPTWGPLQTSEVLRGFGREFSPTEVPLQWQTCFIREKEIVVHNKLIKQISCQTFLVAHAFIHESSFQQLPSNCQREADQPSLPPSPEALWFLMASLGSCSWSSTKQDSVCSVRCCSSAQPGPSRAHPTRDNPYRWPCTGFVVGVSRRWKCPWWDTGLFSASGNSLFLIVCPAPCFRISGSSPFFGLRLKTTNIDTKLNKAISITPFFYSFTFSVFLFLLFFRFLLCFPLSHLYFFL